MKKARFCKRGHDTNICGRGQGRGCKQCATDTRKAKPFPDPKSLKQFCDYGHDTFETGRYEDGRCKICCNIRAKRHHDKTYVRHPKVPRKFCSRGHEFVIVGTNKQKVCFVCRRLWSRVQAWRRWGIINSDGTPFTIDDYEIAFKKQGGRCANALCNKPQSEFKRSLAADHDHETKQFRGLLCANCNTLLGMMEDNFKIIEGLREYLK